VKVVPYRVGSVAGAASGAPPAARLRACAGRRGERRGVESGILAHASSIRDCSPRSAEHGRSSCAREPRCSASWRRPISCTPHGYKEDMLAALSGRPWWDAAGGRAAPRGGARARGVVHGSIESSSAARAAGRRGVGEVDVGSRAASGAARVVHAWNGIVDPLADCTIVPGSRTAPRRGARAPPSG